MSVEEMILPDPARVPQERIATVLAQLAAVQTALLARLILDPGNGGQAQSEAHEPEELLTAEQAAALLSVSTDWMYRHASGLPFTKRLSRKAVRFSRSGLLKWRAGRRA